jgi:hypothetical protein
MSKSKIPGLTRLTYDKWEAEFEPIQNHLNENAPYGGLMFETYGDELGHVLDAANGETEGNVWTLVEGDSGRLVICEGYHLCNRLGYFITAKAPKAGEQYNVKA